MVVRDKIRLWVVHETELVVLNHLKDIEPYEQEELGKEALELCAPGLIYDRASSSVQVLQHAEGVD